MENYTENISIHFSSFSYNKASEKQTMSNMHIPSHPLSLNNIQLSHLINFSLQQLKQTNTFLQGEGACDK